MNRNWNVFGLCNPECLGIDKHEMLSPTVPLVVKLVINLLKFLPFLDF